MQTLLFLSGLAVLLAGLSMIRKGCVGGILLALAVLLFPGYMTVRPWLGNLYAELALLHMPKENQQPYAMAGRQPDGARIVVSDPDAVEVALEAMWAYTEQRCPRCVENRPYVEAAAAEFEVPVPALVAVEWKETNGRMEAVGAAQEYCATQVVSNANPEYPNRPSPQWLQDPANCFRWTARRLSALYREHGNWHEAFWRYNGYNAQGRKYADDVTGRYERLIEAARAGLQYERPRQQEIRATDRTNALSVVARPSATYNRRPAGADIDTIVLHATVGGLSSSLNTLTKAGTGVSSHYLVAKDGTIYYLVDERMRAWHAGVSQMPAPDNRRNVNHFSIGIEIVNRNDGKDPYPAAQVAAVAALVKDIARRHNVPPQNIVTHAQISGKFTGKSDPRGLNVPAIVEYVYS